MKNDKELGLRLSRIVERISRGEFMLLALDLELEEPGIVAVSMRLRRLTGGERASSGSGKRKIDKTKSIELIFEDD